MKKSIPLIFAALISHSVFAEVAVIVHPSNANTMDEGAISRIFLGKAKSFPDGSQVVPISLAESSDTTKEFNKNVLNKSSSQLKAYWSKLVFTGKGTPPRAMDSEEEMIKLISTNPSMIGFVSSDKVTGDVKVLGKF
ncbi:type 2 periplasmic-binding domain-containing protein [Flocculibacter collagenilyticus]|uniref:phosphate ABC transporter substrate-binding protein n=1 Tax=Flocculibacter collagenilyticus TaxID=2744479 RepID=UPI001F3B8D5A|nr:phosphate ABC transporter substrate-binding protein [Flocculibacter collagenilyticus]